MFLSFALFMILFSGWMVKEIRQGSTRLVRTNDGYYVSVTPGYTQDPWWDRSKTVAYAGLGYGIPVLTFTAYSMWYRPSWAIQKPRADNLGAAQRRKRKRQ